MLPLVIVLAALSGIATGLSMFALWKSGQGIEGERAWFGPLRELQGQVEALDLRWIRLMEEVNERVESGNTVWRRIRSTESAKERREERAEEFEGQPVDPAQEVLPFDAAGSDPRGLSYMPEDLDDPTQQPWRVAAKELARQIAGGGS